jgi:hypothetical protein
MSDPLHPSTALLCKLGSVIVHTEELAEPGAHELDLAALDALMTDPEVVEWRAAMDRLALLPKKRSADV